MIMVKQSHKLKVIDSCRFMRSKLSDLVDNLSEINNKDCKTCMERKNIKSECDFIGFKIIDWITDAKNAREHLPSQQTD